MQLYTIIKNKQLNLILVKLSITLKKVTCKINLYFFKQIQSIGALDYMKNIDTKPQEKCRYFKKKFSFIL